MQVVLTALSGGSLVCWGMKFHGLACGKSNEQKSSEQCTKFHKAHLRARSTNMPRTHRNAREREMERKTNRRKTKRKGKKPKKGAKKERSSKENL